MASAALYDPILLTKLHRPAVDENHIHRPSLLERLDQRHSRPLTLVSAPAGYGKSVLISCWLEHCSSPGSWLSLDENDNDLHVFAAYFVAAVEKLFPGTCRNTRSLLNAPTLPPINVLAKNLLNELDSIHQPFIIALDDYHRIKETAVHDLLAAMVEHPSLTMHLVIIGRLDPPMPISRLRAKSQVTELRAQDLRFSIAETKMFLEQLLGIQIDSSTAAAVEEKTEGWVTGLRLTALSMRHRGNLDPILLEPQVDTQYVMEYLFTEVFSHQPPEISQYLMASAILDRFCGPLCEAICVLNGESFSCQKSGWEFITWLKQENMFLIPLDAKNQWFRFHHLFRKLLFRQLDRHFSSEVINALHAKASAWFAENGLLEEALQHALSAGDTETASGLVAQFSHQLMNDEQWTRLERCMNQLPQDRIERDPALVVLEAWLHHIRFNVSGVAACVKKIETLNATSPPDALANNTHVHGHLEVLKGILHYMSADGENALALSRRALEEIPLHHKRARLFADIFQLGGYQMIGNYKTGLSIYQKAMERYINRDKNYHALYLANLGLGYWIEADLLGLRQTAESLLDVMKKRPLPSAVAWGFYLLGIVHFHRNELQNAEEKLKQVVEAFNVVSPMNFAHSAFALALTYQALGKLEQAREISRSIVQNSIETNNADMLQVARAFEAELALYQERFTVASRWMEKYQAKPFVPVFRFYMPQLTAVKVMLAQNTTDSLIKAADLLNQLHNFLESIHNNRFCIDVLALQALLHHARSEESAAVEKLSQALILAEPGGFIRLFVDLGPPMADLLKRLIKQNIAAKYASRILSAFREDAQRVVAGSFHHDQSPDHTVYHPLIEPLSNRELQILDLVAQRLQNKEIATKLFISPGTVKSHLNSIYRKLNVTSRLQAVEKAYALGIFSTLSAQNKR